MLFGIDNLFTMQLREGDKDHERLFLPLELWHECIAYLPIADVKRLSQTCRLFNYISIPFVFKNIKYSCMARRPFGLGRVDCKLDDLERKAEALRRFSENLEYAPLVRKFTASYDCHKSIEWEKVIYQTFVETVVQCFQRFSNLKRIEVKGFEGTVDKKMLDALVQRCPLDAVSFSGVIFGAHNIERPIISKKLFIDTRHALESSSDFEVHSLNIFSSKGLESLTAWTTVYAPKLFLALADQGPLGHLTDISVLIDLENLAEFYVFLSFCPNAKHLEVRLAGVFEGGHFSPPPASIVPLLESSSGFEDAAIGFAPGRPVKKVVIDRLYFTEEPFNVRLRPLSRSTGPVLHLSIESAKSTQVVMGCVTSYFPSLRELEISLEREEDIMGFFSDDDLELDEGTFLPTCADAYDDPIGGGQDLKRRSHFYYVHYHTDYMKLLSSVAAKDIAIPSKLQSLCLFEDIGEFTSHGVPTSDEEEEEYVEIFGAPFSASRAQDLLSQVSELYPALRQIVICKRGRAGLKWSRKSDGLWAYNAELDLARLPFASFDETDEEDSFAGSYGSDERPPFFDMPAF